MQRSHPSYLRTTPSSFVLAVFMLAGLNTFAIFFNGAYFLNAMTLCIVGSWVIVLALIFFNSGEFLASFRKEQWLVFGIAFAFWLWVGLSMIWSISRDATWIEFNRTGGYLAVFAAGMAIGRYRFSRRLAVFLFLITVTAAAVYGLGPKTFPQLIENLDNLSRIAVPIGYTNAMGLLLAMGYIISIYLSTVRDFHWVLRLFSVLAAPLILTCLFFTNSRGALLALLTGLVIYYVVTPVRLRSFGVMMLSFFPVTLISTWSNGQNALMMNSIPVEERQLAAIPLRLYLLISVITAGAVFSIFIILGGKFKFPSVIKKIAGATILSSISISIIVIVTLAISSLPSFGDWAGDAYQRFRYGMPSTYGAARLLEMSTSGRWLFWEEAMSNFQDNPILGTGGQSFPIVHLMRRENEVFVKQPHSHPFQLLTELGLVGYIIGMAFIAVSLACCTLLLCKLQNRWDRALAGAILSVIVVYLIHAAYEWDWNLFGLTMVWYLFTGILMGWLAVVQQDAGIKQNSDLSDPVSHVSGKPS